MSHMVLYSGRDGAVAFTRCNELNEAIAQVERLRNEESVEQVQIFRLEEVKFEIKPYYRVEIPQAVAFDNLVSEPLSFLATTPESEAAPEPVTAPVEDDYVSTSRFLSGLSTAPTTADVPAMVTPPPPPPPPPAPVAPMTYATTSSTADDGDPNVGTRRGLFGR